MVHVIILFIMCKQLAVFGPSPSWQTEGEPSVICKPYHLVLFVCIICVCVCVCVCVHSHACVCVMRAYVCVNMKGERERQRQTKRLVHVSKHVFIFTSLCVHLYLVRHV